MKHINSRNICQAAPNYEARKVVHKTQLKAQTWLFVISLYQQPFVGGELNSGGHENRIHEVKGSAVEDRPRELSGIDVYKAEMQGTEMAYRNGYPGPLSPLNEEALELPTESHDRG